MLMLMLMHIAPNIYCLWFRTCSRTGHGEIHTFAWGTILVWTQMRACMCHPSSRNQPKTYLPCSYQRLYFRNINHPIVRPSVVTRRQEQRNESAQARFSGMDERRSHIFDGETVTSETAAFQLCDITDAMLKEMIEADDEDSLREACNERDGWYTTHALERIKTVLRHKFFSLLLGHVATQEECEALLVPQEGTDKLPQRHRHRLKFGKHNMAKGALPPEDAAVRAPSSVPIAALLISCCLGTPTHDHPRTTEEKPQISSPINLIRTIQRTYFCLLHTLCMRPARIPVSLRMRRCQLHSCDTKSRMRSSVFLGFSISAR